MFWLVADLLNSKIVGNAAGMFYQDLFSAELYTAKQVLESALKKQKRLKQSIITDAHANVPDLRLCVIKTE
jgi:hypothetical protein